MAGEDRGLYVFQDGVLVPAATVKGSKGEQGEEGPPGPPGNSASGVIVADEAPPNPTPWETVWVDVGTFQVIAPLLHVVGDPGEPAYQNNWVRFDNSWLGAGFARLDSGLVVLWGMVKSGAINTPVFTLPPGFRPPGPLLFPAQSNGALGRLDVRANGEVVPQAGSNVYFSLAGACFVGV